MNTLTIKDTVLSKLSWYDLSLEEYYVLYQLYHGVVLSYKVSPNVYTSLVNKKLLVDNMKLSSSATSIMEALESDEDDEKYRRGFEELWHTYPSTTRTRFHLNGRNLRTDKETCYKLYRNLIISGVAHSDIIRGLKNEINFRHLNTNQENNGFEYMRSLSNWLAKKSYLDYLEIDDPGNLTDLDTQIIN